MKLCSELNDKLFRETAPPPEGADPDLYKPTSSLQRKLDLVQSKGVTPVYTPYAHNENYHFACPHGCGHRFKNKRAYSGSILVNSSG